MRTIRHPGVPAAERIRSVDCVAQRLALTLRAGLSVNQAIADAMAEAGFDSGYVRLRSVPVSPLHYVIPARSPDGEHAAWYSETYSPVGESVIEDAGAIFGSRDGEPFIHCHGSWRTDDGVVKMGHLLPLESIVAKATEVEAWGVSGAAFVVQDDPETRFRLFAALPSSASGATGSRRAVIATFRPNQDIVGAIEALCVARDMTSAEIHGIGSLVGASFDDGSGVESYATEVLIERGELRVESGARCVLDIALVGMDGTWARGRLAGSNAVCVTFELLIVER